MNKKITRNTLKEESLNLREKGLLLLVHELTTERGHNRIDTEELLMYSNEEIGYLHDVFYSLEMKDYVKRYVIKDTNDFVAGYEYIINYNHLKNDPIQFEGFLVDDGRRY